MVVFELNVSDPNLNNSFESYWLRSGASTLSEALVLAAGRLLDVEFTDIKAGYRIRRSTGGMVVDIFLYDSLSSGAGYSSELANRVEELFEETKDILEGCNCESSCPDCIDHFWNQNRKKYLNRHFGKQLLLWAKDSVVRPSFTMEEQFELLSPLKEYCDINEEFSLQKINNRIIATRGNHSVDIFVYPVMWNLNSDKIPDDILAINELELKNSLPKVFSQVLQRLS